MAAFIRATEQRAPAPQRSPAVCPDDRLSCAILTCQAECPGASSPVKRTESACEPPASTPAAGPPSSLVPSSLCGNEAQVAPAHLPHPHRDPSPAWDGGASPQGMLVSHLPSTPEPRSGCQGDLGPPEGPGGKGHFPPREASTCPSCSGYLPQASPEAPFSPGQAASPGPRRGGQAWASQLVSSLASNHR